MAEPFDFTGKNIEDTYQRVVQTDGTNFYDGTGSAISIGGGSQNLQQVTDQGSVTTTPITASIISASSYEGFGVVLAEAALSGLPIVSTYNDGVLEIVENKKTGFIVKEHLPLDFAKIAIKILKNDSLRKNLAKNAKKTALLKFDRNINLEKRAWLWRKVSESGLNSKMDLFYEQKFGVLVWTSV